ncbi:MAG: ComEC/Rec2 family competence protein [Janthinobacterium lividum]
MPAAVARAGRPALPWGFGRLRLWAQDLAEAERGRFMPWFAVAAIAGCTQFFLLHQDPPAWSGAVALLGSGVLGLALGALPAGRAIGLVAAAAAFGFTAGQGAVWRAPPVEALPPRAVMVSAVVRGVDVLPDGRRLVLDEVRLRPVAPRGPAGTTPDQDPLQRHVRIRMKRGDATAVAAGDRIVVRALLRPPAPPAYPGGWDLQRDAYFAGLGGGGTALGAVGIQEHAPLRGWSEALQALRDRIAGRTMQALPGAAGTVAATLLTGTTLAIPPADREAFRDSGLAHLLAVAGLHIGIVMGLVMLVARIGLAAWPHAALHWPTKAMAGVAALLAGAAYLLLTGAHVPIMRSFAMASLVTLGIVTGRRALSLRGLALGALALVLIAPQEVVGVSFQMSFAAVLALIAGYEALRPLLARLHGRGWRRLAAHGAGLVLTSLLAGTASAPYAAYHFGHVQVYFILANVLAVPLTAFWVMPLGVLGLLLMPLGLETIAFQPMSWGLEAILWIARGVASWPAATMAVPPMPGPGLAVFSLGLAWLCLWRSRLRLAGMPLMLAGLLSPLASPMPDLLVSPDARLIAIRDGAEYRLQSRPGAARFVRDAWQEHLAAGPLLPLAEGRPAGCDAQACRAGPLLLLRGNAGTAPCDGVSLVVSAEPARGTCRGAALLDRFTVWRDGAHMVWLNGAAAPTVLSDRAHRGARPWVPAPPVPRRVVPDLPVAASESLSSPPAEAIPELPPAASDD